MASMAATYDRDLMTIEAGVQLFSLSTPWTSSFFIHIENPSRPNFKVSGGKSKERTPFTFRKVRRRQQSRGWQSLLESKHQVPEPPPETCLPPGIVFPSLAEALKFG